MNRRGENHKYEMLYHISHLHPRRQMSGAGFCIKLFPALPRAVAASGMSQSHADNWIKSHFHSLLDGHGFELGIYSEHCLRISWGEWGPEHITVPGNGCGLDLDFSGHLHAPPGGHALLPHNVDSITQAHLLLCIFTGIMETFVLNQEMEAMGMKPEKLKDV